MRSKTVLTQNKIVCIHNNININKFLLTTFHFHPAVLIIEWKSHQ